MMKRRNYSCFNSCIGCGCNYNGTCANNTSAVSANKQYDVYYIGRYVDVPMSVYYGSGYTEIECCEDTLTVLKEISGTLKQGFGVMNTSC